MKKLLLIILAIALVASALSGCNHKNVSYIDLSEGITKITVSIDYDDRTKDTIKELSADYREKLLSEFSRTVSEAYGEGLDADEVDQYDGGFYLKFYKGDKQYDDIGINGKCVIYKDKYYPMTQESSDKVTKILTSAYYFPERERVKKIEAMYAWSGRVLLSEEEKENVLDFCAKIISEKKPGKEGDVFDGIDLIFYDENDKNMFEKIYLDDEFLNYNGKCYHLSKSEYNELYNKIIGSIK